MPRYLKGETEMEENKRITRIKKETAEKRAKRLSLYEKKIRELKDEKKE